MPDRGPTLEYATPHPRLWNLVGGLFVLAVAGAWVYGEFFHKDWTVNYRRSECYLAIERGRIGLEFSTGHWLFCPRLEIRTESWPARYWPDPQLLWRSRGGMQFAGFEARVGHSKPGKYGNAIPDSFYYGGVVIPLWFPLAVRALWKSRRTISRALHFQRENADVPTLRVSPVTSPVCAPNAPISRPA